MFGRIGFALDVDLGERGEKKSKKRRGDDAQN
jgi:hypothetical protein